MAGGLAGRGHRVSLLVGEHYPTDGVPEVVNSSTAISVMRYGDTDDRGATTDYEAMDENLTIQAMAQHLDKRSFIPAIRN